MYAEEVINAIFHLCQQPQHLIHELIDFLTQKLRNTGSDISCSDIGSISALNYSLCQLFFTAGHAAIKTVGWLEAVELELKYRNVHASSSKLLENENVELERCVGNTEDEVGDFVMMLREHEIIFGSKSILSTFASLVVEVCSNVVSFDVCFSTLFCAHSRFAALH